MHDLGGAGATEHLLLAQALGLAMARRAADILGQHSTHSDRSAPGQPSTLRHRSTLSQPSAPGQPGAPGQRRPALTRPASGGKRLGTAQYAADDAIFTAVLDAVNECLGRFDARPADDRWCDALLQLLELAQLAAETA